MATLPTVQSDHLRYTIEDYLALERAADERHEYVDGCIYAMAGESPNHGRICTNLLISVGTQIRGTDCEAFSKDMKVRCGPTPRLGASQEGLYAYPDLVVTCGPLQFHDQFQDVLLNPRVIVEVLSPSTEAFDRGKKFQGYTTWLPTLTDYILVAQDQPSVQHYHRDDTRIWTLHMLHELHESLSVAWLRWTVSLSDVYDRVGFAPAVHD